MKRRTAVGAGRSFGCGCDLRAQAAAARPRVGPPVGSGSRRCAPLRGASPAVLGLAARRVTHCAPCGRSVQTPPASQSTKRACRRAAAPLPLLGRLDIRRREGPPTALQEPVMACRQVACHGQRRRAVVVPAGAATIPGSLDGPSESGRVDEETVLGLGGRPGAWSGERGYRRRPAAAASAREVQPRSHQRRTTALLRTWPLTHVSRSTPRGPHDAPWSR